MLVLSRKPGEKLVIGDGVTITVLGVKGRQVRVGIEAPETVCVLRGELACWQGACLNADLHSKSPLLSELE
jgi:carbon storage regulator